MLLSRLFHRLLLANASSLVIVPPEPDQADFSPMLFFMVMAALAIVLILIGIGIVIALCAFSLLAILITLGILSTSTLVALKQKRFLSGLRAFHRQFCCLLGILLGSLAAVLLSSLYPGSLSPGQIFTLGISAGTLAGFLFALLLERVGTLATQKLKSIKLP